MKRRPVQGLDLFIPPLGRSGHCGVFEFPACRRGRTDCAESARSGCRAAGAPDTYAVDARARSALDRPTRRRPQGDPRPIAIDHKKIASRAGHGEELGNPTQDLQNQQGLAMVLSCSDDDIVRPSRSPRSRRSEAIGFDECGFTCGFALNSSALFVHCSPRSFARTACPSGADVSEELLEAHALVCDLGHRITLRDLQPTVSRKKAELVAVFHAGDDRRKF
jgi:hypothetical protein